MRQLQIRNRRLRLLLFQQQLARSVRAETDSLHDAIARSSFVIASAAFAASSFNKHSANK